jgi:hypothetical protein
LVLRTSIRWSSSSRRAGGEAVGECDNADAASPVGAGFDACGELEDDVEFTLDPFFDLGSLHLDDDLASVEELRAVDLADRGGCDRRALKRGEAFRERPELGLQERVDRLGRCRGDAILQRCQLDGDGWGKQVGAGGENLAELDEDAAGFLQRLGQVAPEALLTRGARRRSGG